jgi:hypothetical protein
VRSHQAWGCLAYDILSTTSKKRNHLLNRNNQELMSIIEIISSVRSIQDSQEIHQYLWILNAFSMISIITEMQRIYPTVARMVPHVCRSEWFRKNKRITRTAPHLCKSSNTDITHQKVWYNSYTIFIVILYIVILYIVILYIVILYIVISYIYIVMLYI